MKLIVIAILLAVLGSTMAASGYVKLSSNTINNNQVIQDLRQLGAEYTLQRGIFRSTQDPLENGNWYISKTVSVYRKISSAVTYYKYTVILKSNSSPTEVRAIYTVAFRLSNGNTLITAYSYKTLLNNDNEHTTDLPQFIDTRTIPDNAYLSGKLQEGYDFAIAHALATGDIRDATYHLGTTFSAGDNGFTTPYVFNFLVTLVTKSGYTYRARISVPDLEEIPEDQWDNYPVTYVIYPNK